MTLASDGVLLAHKATFLFIPRNLELSKAIHLGTKVPLLGPCFVAIQIMLT